MIWRVNFWDTYWTDDDDADDGRNPGAPPLIEAVPADAVEIAPWQPSAIAEARAMRELARCKARVDGALLDVARAGGWGWSPTLDGRAEDAIGRAYAAEMFARYWAGGGK